MSDLKTHREREQEAAPLSAELRSKIDAWNLRYPADRKASGVLQALHYVQAAHGGSLTDSLLNAVADYLGMARSSVYEVATFYTLYNLKPVGRHEISICTNLSCMLRGSEDILKHLESRLGIHVEQTTADGEFTLKEVECLGACIGAPMFQIGKQYYEHLTPEKVDHILEDLRKGQG